MKYRYELRIERYFLCSPPPDTYTHTSPTPEMSLWGQRRNPSSVSVAFSLISPSTGDKECVQNLGGKLLDIHLEDDVGEWRTPLRRAVGKCEKIVSLILHHNCLLEEFPNVFCDVTPCCVV